MKKGDPGPRCQFFYGRRAQIWGAWVLPTITVIHKVHVLHLLLPVRNFYHVCKALTHAKLSYAWCALLAKTKIPTTMSDEIITWGGIQGHVYNKSVSNGSNLSSRVLWELPS